MKKFLLFFSFVLLGMVSQTLAQERLSDWLRDHPRKTAPMEIFDRASDDISDKTEEPARKPKRIAFIFSQTHKYDPETGKFVPDDNILFRVGNYVHVRSALIRYGKFDQISSLAGSKMTKGNIKKVFQTLAKETRQGDVIFIYWESHGYTDYKGVFPDKKNEEADSHNEFLYLGIPFWDEVITDDEFEEMLLLLKGRHVMLLMEACHSGGLLSSEAQSKGFSQNKSVFGMDNPKTFTEDMDKLCKEYDYTSLAPLMDGIITSSYVPRADMEDHDEMASQNAGGVPGFFNNMFPKTTSRDIRSDHKGLSVIFSTGEEEDSYCALVNANGEIVAYDLKKNRWITMNKMKKNILPVSAPVFALIVALSDTTGKYSPKDHTDFADVWAIVKDLVPANYGRINGDQQSSESNSSQTPQYLGNAGPIEIRPAD